MKPKFKLKLWLVLGTLISIFVCNAFANSEPTVEVLQPTKGYIANKLEEKQAQLRTFLADSEAYDVSLIEQYYSIAQLQLELNNYSEAIESFKQSLHIDKIENGIYSPRQFAGLQQLFAIYLLQEKREEAEDIIKKVLWLDQRNKKSSDTTFSMLVRMGNAYIDDYITTPIKNEDNLKTLEKAKKYFANAFAYSSNKTLEMQLPPYGEMALIALLGKDLEKKRRNSFAPYLEDVESSSKGTVHPGLQGKRTLSQLSQTENLLKISTMRRSYPRAIKLLEKYLAQAVQEKNIGHVVRAQLSLGDVYSAFSRTKLAWQHYQRAWKNAQFLPKDDALYLSFSQPAKIPGFWYSYPRDNSLHTSKVMPVNVKMIVSATGKGRVLGLVNTSKNNAHYLSKAKRKVKHMIFRPLIIVGKKHDSEPFEFTLYLRGKYTYKRREK